MNLVALWTVGFLLLAAIWVRLTRSRVSSTQYLSLEEKVARRVWRAHPGLRWIGGLIIVGSLANAIVLATMGMATPAITAGCLALAAALLVLVGFRREYRSMAKQARENEWG